MGSKEMKKAVLQEKLELLRTATKSHAVIYFYWSLMLLHILPCFLLFLWSSLVLYISLYFSRIRSQSLNPIFFSKINQGWFFLFLILDSYLINRVYWIKWSINDIIDGTFIEIVCYHLDIFFHKKVNNKKYWM